MSRPLVLLVPLLAVLLALPPQPAAAKGDLAAAKKSMGSALRSKKPTERARAFEGLRDRSELAALECVVSGYAKVQKLGLKIRKDQEKAEKAFEGLIDKLEAAKAKFEESDHTGADIDRFNKTTRKLDKDIIKARGARKALETDWLANRALLDSATGAATSILKAMDDATLVEGLRVLATAWRDLPAETEGPQRWLETLVDVKRKPVTQAFLGALRKEDLPLSTHVAAMRALGFRRDPEAIQVAKDLLHAPPPRFPLVAAAITALREAHDRRCIVPLIWFLGRQDIERLRQDAREALVSLTGEKHGPYEEPWSSWWVEKKDSFTMPAEPRPLPTEPGDQEGVSFYGIHTFSKRVLFIVDISASMQWALGGQRGEPGGAKAKMVTAKRELVGAVNGLDKDAVFNVILFHHGVIPWQSRPMPATEANKKKLSRWVEAAKPAGLTNINDALTLGFKHALNTTGRPSFDTIFFLTDGKPTAGRITQPDKILAEIALWNSVAQIRINVIGIGGDEDLDPDFLRQLAAVGANGTFIRRSQ